MIHTRLTALLLAAVVAPASAARSQQPTTPAPQAEVGPKLGEMAPDFEFTEPSLVFSYSVRPAPRLRVRFAHECAPPWLKTHQDRIEGLTLEFPVSGRDAADLATSVRSILSDFPIRGGAA